MPCLAAQVAQAVAAALAEARNDWYVERRIFGLARGYPCEADLPWWEQEDWSGDATRDCPRSQTMQAVAKYPAECSVASTDGGAVGDAAAFLGFPMFWNNFPMIS